MCHYSCRIVSIVAHRGICELDYATRTASKLLIWHLGKPPISWSLLNTGTRSHEEPEGSKKPDCQVLQGLAMEQLQLPLLLLVPRQKLVLHELIWSHLVWSDLIWSHLGWVLGGLVSSCLFVWSMSTSVHAVVSRCFESKKIAPTGTQRRENQT